MVTAEFREQDYRVELASTLQATVIDIVDFVKPADSVGACVADEVTALLSRDPLLPMLDASNSLIRARNSSEIKGGLLRLGMCFNLSAKEVLKSIVTNEGITQLLPSLWDTVMAGESDKIQRDFSPRFLLAELLAQYPPEEMPENMRERVDGLPFIDYEILPFYDRWGLCMASEGYMQNAISDGRQGAQYDGTSLLVKSQKEYGYVTAVALNPARTRSGVLVPGIWYSQTSLAVQDDLVRSSKNGSTHFDLPGSQWAIMSEYTEYTILSINHPDSSFQACRKYAAVITEAAQFFGETV